MAGGSQIFVRNREGKVFGPIEPSTVELLIEGGILQGLLQVSIDGEAYALPFRFPEIRDFFPRHLWGDDNRRDVPLDSDGATTEPAPAVSDAPSVTVTTHAAPSAAPVLTADALGHPTHADGSSRAPASATRAPTGTPAPPVLTAAPVEPAAPPPGLHGAVTRAPAGSPPPPILSATPIEPAAPAPSVPEAPPVPPPTPIAPVASAAGRTTGSMPRPPVLTATPLEPILQAPGGQSAPTGAPPLLDTDEPWGEALPFELAPPGSPKPPPHTPAPPLTSTFSVLRAELADTNALKVYVQGARAGATGLFFFDLEDRTTTLYMRRGNPESAESTHPSDAIGPFLVAQRLATPEQIARAEREAMKYGNDVLAALFTLGVVNPGLVFPALAQRAADILLQAYLAPRGSFRFEPLELPASKVVPLGNRWGLLAEVIRRVPLPELKARLMDVRERPVVRRGAGDALPDLRLTAQETRAASYFDGTRSLAHLAQSNAGEMDTILRIALLLRELDAVSFPDVTLRAPPVAPPRPVSAAPTPSPRPAPPPRTPTPAPAAPAAAPPRKPAAPAPSVSAADPPGVARADPPRIAPMAPAPAPRPPASPSFAAELRELQARLERIRKETHFQVLGIPENAEAKTVRAAYFKLAKQFHPDTVPPEAPPDLGRVKAEIFTAIGEANRVLADDASRAHYREALAFGGPADVDVQAVLMAEETFNKGTALVRARRFPEAVKNFDDAIAANPKEGEFYAWRGYARFFTLQDKKVAMVEALRDLNQSLKLNERCAPAHYFIGQLHKLTGDPATALKHFKRCVGLDPQHVDAQREIRIATQK